MDSRSEDCSALARLSAVPAVTQTQLDGALLLYRRGELQAALEAVSQFLSAGPNDLRAMNLRAMLLDMLGRRVAAEGECSTILALDPSNADAMANMGTLHWRAGEFERALAWYNRSLAVEPRQANVIFNRAIVRLILGEWTQGFAELESRWHIQTDAALRMARLGPRWSGHESLAGKTILLLHEQGYGDTLHFCRYAPLLVERGARVVIGAPKPLKRLLLSLAGLPHVVTPGERIPLHDYCCPLMSLPHLFRTTPDTVPAAVPYLHAERNDVNRWHAKLRTLGPRSRCRIGVTWRGRGDPPGSPQRSMTLATLMPVFALDADFICLQTDLAPGERDLLQALSNIHCFGDEGDFSDSAALIENLDLVITIDTAAAHLAGALARPVWLMNPYASSWRWLLERTDSPWYPTMRIFRQQSLGDWNSVVHDVKCASAWFVA